ncbi:RDD family protein [Paenibacillus donghaensis]|uniref:RDD family protein n=1 Tax=Paenibacillus donghaensis TaxID=414771 RepID=UPI001883584D|nr:RDD family protein [Paenibacillus donghaensis]MBE9918319.1 RDD family protein [Paenibacillus donghaensis]
MTQQTAGGPTYAGFWIRGIALLLDSAILFAVSLLIRKVTPAPAADTWFSTAELITSIIGLVYFVALTCLFGQTIGKKIVGIRVVSQDGGQAGGGKVLVRETIGRFLSDILLLIGYLMAAFSLKKLALHDRLAGTCVVRVKS